MTLTFQEKTHSISGTILEEEPNGDRGKVGLVQRQLKEAKDCEQSPGHDATVTPCQTSSLQECYVVYSFTLFIATLVNVHTYTVASPPITF